MCRLQLFVDAAVMAGCFVAVFFFFQAEDGIRDLVRSRGLGDVYKRQAQDGSDARRAERGRLRQAAHRLMQ